QIILPAEVKEKVIIEITKFKSQRNTQRVYPPLNLLITFSGNEPDILQVQTGKKTCIVAEVIIDGAAYVEKQAETRNIFYRAPLVRYMGKRKDGAVSSTRDVGTMDRMIS